MRSEIDALALYLSCPHELQAAYTHGTRFEKCRVTLREDPLPSTGPRIAFFQLLSGRMLFASADLSHSAAQRGSAGYSQHQNSSRHEEYPDVPLRQHSC
jgi:hypothetical protein